MAKTIISAFDSPQVAARVLDSVISGGFESCLFSVITPKRDENFGLDAVIQDVPSISARLYKQALKKGESLLVARTPENEVKRLIRLLQAAGGNHIEAFDYSASSQNH
ncbi:MAG: hypothetical protein ICV60_00935 [Pyrinomonadaceae bacterium]|nr:hypothetical protein [Pyrinomonadaceae bacterium]